MSLTGFEGLKNKVVIITGASSGIGAETAVYMGKIGCRVLITGRNKDNLEATRKRCLEAGVAETNVISFIGDVSKSADCQAIIQKAVDSFGALDVLVNNAGILVPGSLLDTSEEDYDRQMDGNVRSVFLMTKAAIPHLIATKGSIVNVSSVCGTRAFPGVCVYNMSKGALDQLTRTVALELAPEGVRVNSVNPGVILTDIHRRGGMSEEQYQQYLDHSKTTHALGRVGNTEEPAAAIAFLASPLASFTTGCLLPVDGGRGIMCPR